VGNSPNIQQVEYWTRKIFAAWPPPALNRLLPDLQAAFPSMQLKRNTAARTQL